MLFSPAKERRHNSWSLMICYNKQFRLLSLPHRYCTHSVSLYSDYIMNSFGKSTHLFVNILSPLFSSLSLPHPSLFWFSEWDRILPPSPDWTQVCSHLPASSSLSLGLQSCSHADILFWKHKCRDFIATRVHSFCKDFCWIFLWGGWILTIIIATKVSTSTLANFISWPRGLYSLCNFVSSFIYKKLLGETT